MRFIHRPEMVVAGVYMVARTLPLFEAAAGFTLPLVTGIGLFTISLCVVASLVSGYYFLRKEEKEFSREIDTISWKFIGLGFLIVNIVLPISAFS